MNYELLKSFKHVTVAMGSSWFLSRKLSQLGARVHALISALPVRVDHMAVSPYGTSSGARPNHGSRLAMNVVTKSGRGEGAKIPKSPPTGSAKAGLQVYNSPNHVS